MYLWGKAPRSKAVQVEVLGLDHLAVAAVDPLKGDGVRGIALDQALHLKRISSTLQDTASAHILRHLLCQIG